MQQSLLAPILFGRQLKEIRERSERTLIPVLTWPLTISGIFTQSFNFVVSVSLHVQLSEKQNNVQTQRSRSLLLRDLTKF